MSYTIKQFFPEIFKGCLEKLEFSRCPKGKIKQILVAIKTNMAYLVSTLYLWIITAYPGEPVVFF